ncbi:DUF2339 domain-containing protein [bacterium]|nr:DUF2339 domain-containing protein [bacterium]
MIELLFLIVIVLIFWIINTNSKIDKLNEEANHLKSEFNFINKKLISLTERINNTPEDKQIIKQQNDNNNAVPDIIQQPSFEEIEESIDNTEDSNNDIHVHSEDYTQSNNISQSSYKYQNTIPQSTLKKDNDFEKVVLGRVFTIVGSIAIILGCCFFILVISHLLTPMMKSVIGILAGCGIITIGLKIKKESLKKYAEALIGTGFGVLFITVFCSTVIAHTFSITICTIIGLLILLAAYLIADKQKTVSMVAIALVGGYLNIFMISSEISLNFLFSYLIFLNIMSMLFVIRNYDKNIINHINIITSTIFAVPFILCSSSKLNIIFPIILWIMYLLYDFSLRIKHEDYDEFGLLCWFNYISVSTIIGFMFGSNKTAIGCSQLILAISYGIMACYFILKASDKVRIYLRIMLLSIYLSIFLFTEGTLRLGLWALAAIILSYVAKNYNRDYLAKWSLGFLFSSVIGIFILNNDMYYLYNPDNYKPLFNMRTLSFIAPVLAAFVSGNIIGKMDFNESKKISSFLNFGAISLIYIWITFEIGDFIQYSTGESPSAAFIKCMTYAIIGSIYSIQMYKMSEITKNTLFAIPSVIIGIVTLILLYSAGLSYTPVESFIPVANIRFIAYVIAIAGTIYLSGKVQKNSDILKYLAVILGFTLLTVETNDFIGSMHNDKMYYLISVVWIIYLGIITAIGIFKNKKFLKNSGIFITIITIIKILFVDMAHVDFGYKMFVFIILGAVLMITSYYYNKLQK